MIKNKFIFLTGSSGFVGTNLKSFLDNKYEFCNYNRSTFVEINQESVIHLAGIVHDLKNISNSVDYYKINTELTIKIFDAFLSSKSKVFIFLSSVKAVSDEVDVELSEDVFPNPITHYGKSKLLAEQYIFSQQISEDKRVYILRPCMIHGPGNKGNLNLLHKLVLNNIPWPLGAFDNKRSFCSIENLIYIIRELIERNDIPSGIYNVSDDEYLSTNELIRLIAFTTNKKARILSVSKKLINFAALLGDILHLPLNTERLGKLTGNFVVSNTKIKTALGIKKLPVSAKDGLVKTITSFN